MPMSLQSVKKSNVQGYQAGIKRHRVALSGGEIMLTNNTRITVFCSKSRVVKPFGLQLFWTELITTVGIKLLLLTKMCLHLMSMLSVSPTAFCRLLTMLTRQHTSLYRLMKVTIATP